ncbi:MAG: hypothetical protein B6I38_06725 [Anaerolineaceae bacterium 4572_5.1]|nr:MAG: hypothetical protein B6I38_06725 [Anaerolineaceae bacterium 4572_5.1]RLD05395.1 MAG: hypothetical protein DRI56_09730 [Chloroflexota bacterium]
MPDATIYQAIPMLTEPFVQAGIYSTPEQALKRIVLDYVERQISWAEVEMQRLERKHKQSFSEWSGALSGKASIADEDDWMEWESLQDMAKSWKQLKTAIEKSDV